jgi:hypothetical protein
MVLELSDQHKREGMVEEINSYHGGQEYRKGPGQNIARGHAPSDPLSPTCPTFYFLPPPNNAIIL